MNERSQVLQTISRLRFGDRIDVYWFDASEAAGRVEGAKFDTRICSTGFFLGIKGKARRHVVIAKEVVDGGNAYHYNVIPVEMINKITLVQKNALGPKVKWVLKKFFHQTMSKLTGKDGWAYAKGKNPKSIH